MSRGLKNNNPGNIRHSNTNWQGEIKGVDKEFKTFKSIDWGYRAMFKLLNTYERVHGLNTIEKIMHRYAPTNENDTNAYIRAIEQDTGINRHTIISTKDKDCMVKIVASMSRVENGVKADLNDVIKGWELYIK